MNSALRSRRAPTVALERDGQLARVRFLARLLDNQFAIPGTPYRIGIDPLLGLVPGIGDALAAVMSVWIIVSAARLGAPAGVLARMGMNVGVDALVGIVPVVGDLFDAGYKANVRNVRLLEGWVVRPAPTRRASGALVAVIVVAALLLAAVAVLATWKLLSWAFATVQS